jgi:SAM-dependent methyltransferase
MENRLFALPREGIKFDDCFFYHTIDLPKTGTALGYWDLRQSTDIYLGNVQFQGKSVLEVGVANGYFSFYMERKGARVVGFDLCEDFPPDVVPFARQNTRHEERVLSEHVRKQVNGYWFSHQELQSKAKVVYGSIYSLPDLGEFDICTFGAVLLHLRDPFKALENALRYTRETVIVTEPMWRGQFVQRIFNYFFQSFPFMLFLPNPKTLGPNNYSWWFLPPQTIIRFLAVLGFVNARVLYHRQKANGLGGRMIPHYTIVAQRVDPLLKS